MKTKTTTWLAQIVAVLLMLAAGSASASSGLLVGNSCQGKNTLEGGLHRGLASISAETCRGCGEICSFDAAELFVAPVRQTLGRSANSTVLGQNLEAVSGAARPANSAAHHIVAGEARAAAEARAILAREGIDINEAANGAFLPRNSSVAAPPAQTHSTVHTNAYYEAVNTRLREAAPGTVRDVLGQIADELLNGTFPH